VENDTNVQDDSVLENTETELEDTGTLPEGEVPEKPLTIGITTEALKAMLYEMFEPIKRDVQGATDRSHSAIEKVRLLESISTGIEQGFKDLDPEAAESAKEKAELNYRRQQDSTRQAQDYSRRVYDDLVQHLQELDIDPKDERIDWGKDTKNPMEGRRAFDKSVVKIIKEKAKAIGDTIAKRDKEEQAKADSVDTSVSAGAGGKGIPTNMDSFQRWVANLSDEEYAAKQADIDEMLRSGRIK